MPKPRNHFSFALAALAACAVGEDPIIPGPPLPNVVIDPAELILNVGVSARLHAFVLGYPESEPITWSVADPSLASVDETGLVTTDICGPLGSTRVTAAWAAHPEERATSNITVAMQTLPRVFVEGVTDAVSEEPSTLDALTGIVDVHAQIVSHGCRRIERLDLILISNGTELLVAAIAMDPERPTTMPPPLRWNTRNFANGDYKLVVEAKLPLRRDRSAPLPIRVLNQD